MDTKPVLPDPTRELALPGTRAGEGSDTLWEYLARDEQQKTSNRGGGKREASNSQQPVHPMRRSTDRR